MNRQADESPSADRVLCAETPTKWIIDAINIRNMALRLGRSPALGMSVYAWAFGQLSLVKLAFRSVGGIWLPIRPLLNLYIFRTFIAPSLAPARITTCCFAVWNLAQQALGQFFLVLVSSLHLYLHCMQGTALLLLLFTAINYSKFLPLICPPGAYGLRRVRP
jgi:hypothetical protein